MKKKNKLLMVFGFIFAILVGFLIGISVDYPEVNNKSVSGTIGKINNYRNSQSSKSDITLQNELTSDTSKLISVSYLIQVIPLYLFL